LSWRPRFFSAVGIIHALRAHPGGVANRFGSLAAPEFFLGYLLLALLFFAAALYAKQRKGNAVSVKASVQAVSLPYTLIIDAGDSVIAAVVVETGNPARAEGSAVVVQ
jgi:hypothetical protein